MRWCLNANHDQVAYSSQRPFLGVVQLVKGAGVNQGGEGGSTRCEVKGLLV